MQSPWVKTHRSRTTLLKPEVHFTEDIHDRTLQVKTSKPVPWVDNYMFQLRRVQFPPAKGYAGLEMVCPARNCPQHPGMVYREATAATGRVPTQGLSDLGSKWVQQRRAKPCSPLTQLNRWIQTHHFYQVWRNVGRFCGRVPVYKNLMAQREWLRITGSYPILAMLYIQLWSVEETINMNGWNPTRLC